MKCKSTTKQRTPRTQAPRTGVESQRAPRPECGEKNGIRRGGSLDGKFTFASDDSGRGAAVSLAIAKEGADVAIGRSALCRSLVDTVVKMRGRPYLLVNTAGATVPIWTSLIPTTFSSEKVKTFGSRDPLARASQPDAVRPGNHFLASSESSYITGQVLHAHGGETVNT